MRGQEKPIIIIVGPTASGKSALAVKIAKVFEGEIISADSRQVYKGLNIGTGKITKSEMRGVPHYALDVASPKKTFTVAQYVKIAEMAIKKIEDKKKIPVICGGTGFYVRALIDKLDLPMVPPNKKLRTKLKKKSAEELFKILKSKDAERASTIDKHNTVRIIRALEIVEALGKVPKLKSAARKNVLFIGINIPKEKLRDLIRARLKKRIRSGMLKEIERLHQRPPNIRISWKRLENLGLEYRYGAYLLQKKITKTEFEDKLFSAIIKYSKRQMTWFRADKRIHWITKEKQAISLVRNFLQKEKAH